MNIYQHNNLFLDNKYTKWYYSIVTKAQNSNRVKLKRDNLDFVYYENHHILPRCMFPEYSNLSENKWNGVLLTAKEHFICHALLCKMTFDDNKYKMLYAFHKIQYSDKNQQRYTSRLYNYFKKKFKCSDETKKKISDKNKNPSEITRNKLSKVQKGRKQTIERIEHRRLLNIGKKRNLEFCEKYKGEGNPFYGKTHTKELKERMSKTRKNMVSCKDINNNFYYISREEFLSRKGIDLFGVNTNLLKKINLETIHQ